MTVTTLRVAAEPFLHWVVSKLHSLGWTHKVEIEEGVEKLYEWYRQSLED